MGRESIEKIFTFVPMGHRKTLSALFCILAFTVVFAHSVVPHEHHCSEAVEQHIHHFQHCEGLNTFVLKQDNPDRFQTGCILQAALVRDDSDEIRLPQSSVRLLPDCRDRFRIRACPDIPPGALRGPPGI